MAADKKSGKAPGDEHANPVNPPVGNAVQRKPEASRFELRLPDRQGFLARSVVVIHEVMNGDYYGMGKTEAAAVAARQQDEQVPNTFDAYDRNTRGELTSAWSATVQRPSADDPAHLVVTTRHAYC